MSDMFGTKNMGKRGMRTAPWKTNTAQNGFTWDGFGGDAKNSLGMLYDPGNFFGWDDGEEEDPYAGMPGGAAPYIGMEADQLNTPIEWDRRAEGKLNEEALRDGLSKNSLLALDENAAGVNRAKSGIRGTAAGLEGQARSNLAMKGGLDSGASERIAKNSMTNALDLSQQAEAGGNRNMVEIRMQDEDRRLAGLDNAQGMNRESANSLFNMRNRNLQNVIGETGRRNAYNMNNYNQSMQAWAAGKQANAAKDDGKKA